MRTIGYTRRITLNAGKTLTSCMGSRGGNDIQIIRDGGGRRGKLL